MISQPTYMHPVSNEETFENFSTYTVNQTETNSTNNTEPGLFLNATIWKILWMVHPNISQVCQAIALACITLIGIIGNLVLLLSLPWISNVNRNLLDVVTSIALCDILVCMVLPYKAYLIVTHDNNLEHIPCTIQGVIITFPGLLKNFNMVQISLLCYMMVWNPTKHFKFQSSSCVNLCIIVSWCLAAGFCCIPFFWHSPQMDLDVHGCNLEILWNVGYKMFYLTQFFFTAIFYGISLLFVQCGIHKLKAKLELNSRRRRRKKHTSETKRKNHIHQAVAFSTTASIMFVMTMPYNASIFVHFLLGTRIMPDLFILISYYVSVLHVIINPILYACHIRKVTEAYLKVIRYIALCLCASVVATTIQE